MLRAGYKGAQAAARKRVARARARQRAAGFTGTAAAAFIVLTPFRVSL